MKRNIILLAALAMMMAACSFKQKANSRLKSYVASTIPDPGFSIIEKEYIWDDDSLCIIDFKMRVRNVYGGYEFKNGEYILVRENGVTYEHLINTDKKLPIYSRTLSYIRNVIKNPIEGEYEAELHRESFYEAAKHGRRVK